MKMTSTQVQETKHLEDPDSDISNQRHDLVTAISEEHSCSICLKLYRSTIQVSACGHVFCEECLRLWVENKLVNTPCRLCRQVISGCLTNTLKTLYPSYHERRGGSDPLPQFSNTTPLPRRTTERNNNNIWFFNFVSLFLQTIVGFVTPLCYTVIRFYRETFQEVAKVPTPCLILRAAVSVLLLFLFVISVLYFVWLPFWTIIKTVAYIFGQIILVIVKIFFYPDFRPLNPNNNMPTMRYL